MALRVWLPLNGNLENRGISNLSFQTAGTINIDANGKIGQTYTADSAGTIVSNQMIDLGTKLSMFGWVKINTFNNSPIGIFGQHRFSNFTGMGLNFLSNGKLSVNTGDGSSRTWNSYVGTTTLNTNTWYHVGFTYDGSKIRIYINGVMDKEYTYTSQLNVSDYVYMYGWSLAGASGNDIYMSYKLSGSLNDVRIYDECLSQKRIKEISKGLVAHYKFDNPYIESTTNLVPANIYNYTSVPGAYYSGIRNIVQFQGETCFSVTTVEGNGYADGFICQQTSNCVEGETYTYSGYIWIPEGHNWSIGMRGINGGGGVYHQTITGNGQWQYFYKTFVATDNTSGMIQGYESNSNDTAHTVYLKKLQLEKKDHATPFVNGSRNFMVCPDVSGYKYDLTKHGNFLTFDDSARYTKSTIRESGTGNYLHYTGLYLGDASTFCAWVKPINLGSTTQWCMYLGGGTGNASEIQHGWYITTSGIRMSAGSQLSYDVSLDVNKWYHIATVADGNQGKIYLNGELVVTGTITFVQKNILTLFDRSNNTSGSAGAGYQYMGSLSDARVYATALSADDIKELYQTSAWVDNKQNIMAYEFKEV